MKGARIDAVAQLSLLDWVPPSPVAAFDPALMRANAFDVRLARAVSIALTECGRSREQIADSMSRQMQRHISVNMLNAYASPTRDTHVISVPRFDALLGATGDQRLLEFIAEPHGLAVVDRRLLPMITLAETQMKQRELSKMAASLRRAAYRGVPR